MAAKHVLNVDLAKVYKTPERGGFLKTVAWGDEIEVLGTSATALEIRTTTFTELPDGSIQPSPASGFIVPTKSSGLKPAQLAIPKSQNEVLKVDFVDVQQGDGSVIQTPSGKVVLVDGGDNQLFARYLANQFRGTSAARPKEIDCILVTHGDADHFLGLTEMHRSETEPRLKNMPWKRLFIHPRRVYHNGLVKRPGKVDGKTRKDVEMLGATKVVDGTTYIVGLETNLLDVPDDQMNAPFLAWKKALKTYKSRGPITFRRLAIGDHAAFDFLQEDGVEVEVLGPITTALPGGKTGLAFLGDPPRGPRVGHESVSLDTAPFKGFSASHTINGHSIIIRLTYGGFHFLFAGDLNDQASRILTRAHNDGTITLRSEVFKVPHHGSADFSGAFFEAVSPIVSVVSSGDENARKEYIHPRATLMGALGKYSRFEEPLIFVTEMVAFFQVVGNVRPESHKLKNGIAVIEDGAAVLDKKAGSPFFAFRRTAFGIVRIRTDGERLLVFTDSGKSDLKEAYAYVMDEAGKPMPAPVQQA